MTKTKRIMFIFFVIIGSIGISAKLFDSSDNVAANEKFLRLLVRVNKEIDERDKDDEE